MLDEFKFSKYKMICIVGVHYVFAEFKFISHFSIYIVFSQTVTHYSFQQIYEVCNIIPILRCENEGSQS